jgi:hypothetical protein
MRDLILKEFACEYQYVALGVLSNYDMVVSGFQSGRYGDNGSPSSRASAILFVP